MDLCLIADATTPSLWQSILNGIVIWGMVLIGLGFVIFVHELGHFLAAKACGVKAEKFYIGFDIPLGRFINWLRGMPGEFTLLGLRIPRTVGPKVRWGETEYGIGILPLGGYVKMLGQDDDPRKFKEEQARALAAAEGKPIAPEAVEASQSKDPPGEADESRPVYDPRSYQAKSVPQRMLIISAGVIMNLIFAVIMAAVAYGMGVPYTPTVLGQTIAGSPGWVSDLRPGDKIVRLGAEGEIDPTIRLESDLVAHVVFASGPVDLLVERPSESSPVEVTVTPVARPDSDLQWLGVNASYTTTIRDLPELPRMASVVAKELQAGDKIIAINGKPLPVAKDEEEDQAQAYTQLQYLLANQPGQELTLTVERTEKDADGKELSTTTKDVKLPAQPLRTLGLTMQLGPIVAIRKNSPIERTGKIEVGDRIVSINGEAIGDPLTLSQRLLKLVGQKDVPIVVERTVTEKGKDSTVRIERVVTPVAPLQLSTPLPEVQSYIAIEPLGIAAPVEFKVTDVYGAAAKAGLKAGDEIVGLQLVSDDEKVIAEAKKTLQEPFEQITLDENKFNWVVFHSILQLLPDGLEVDVTYRRDGKLETKRLTPFAMEDGYYESRGLRFAAFRKTHTATSLGDAVALGFRETKNKLGEVVKTLKSLVTRRVSTKHTSGILGIGQAAYSQANQGWPTLLIFLTFLSANLAFVNFLPIPILDGGHMVFLAAEGIRGKPIDEGVQYYSLLVGGSLLLFLMVYVLKNDVVRMWG